MGRKNSLLKCIIPLLLAFAIALYLRKSLCVIEGESSYGIKWTYDSLLRVLRFEMEEKSDGMMHDYTEYDSTGDGDEIFMVRVPWAKYKDHCRKVIFGKGIKRVGNYTCADFSELRTIELSTTITEVGNCAFYNCSNLKIITLSNSLQKIGDAAFCSTSLEKAVFPKEIKAIGEDAFAFSKLREITLPGGKTSIGESAFAGCWDLEKVNLDEDVEVIPKECFKDCDIKEFVIPLRVKFIRAGFLKNNMGIQKIHIESKRISWEGAKDIFSVINPKVVVEVPKEKYDEYKEMLYTHGLPETAKVVAY
ncbi:Leucine rich repeat-containing protein [Lachnospiraceae bacterium XBB1006]|nr:Leucine rich repeat-containing protein [Lachnospiraceae bacterium XBB1006]